MTYLFFAIVVSVALIALLWRGDPKRRRTAGLRGIGHGPVKRRALAAMALLPGIGLATTGDSSSFLVWFGACAVAGWLMAQLQPPRSDGGHGRNA